jgi:hypothetical protein
MKKDKEWYNEESKKNDVSVYYNGEYKKRNDILISMIKALMPEEAKILDLAAGSTYIAEELINLASVKEYLWNDFNENISKNITDKISNKNFIINLEDANSENINFSKYNIFICVSLEHIEQDIEILKKLNKGTLVAICSPNYNAKSHVRYFENEDLFRERYKEIIDEKIFSTISKTKKIKILKKYILCGFIK